MAKLVLKDEEHEVGDAECPTCLNWMKPPYPRKCSCGGLLHSYGYDESWDEESGEDSTWWLVRCDRCGRDANP